MVRFVLNALESFELRSSCQMNEQNVIEETSEVFLNRIFNRNPIGEIKSLWPGPSSPDWAKAPNSGHHFFALHEEKEQRRTLICWCHPGRGSDLAPLPPTGPV